MAKSREARKLKNAVRCSHEGSCRGGQSAADQTFTRDVSLLAFDHADQLTERFDTEKPSAAKRRRRRSFDNSGAHTIRRRIEQGLRAEIARLERLAGEDPLTGLANRRVFETRLAGHLDTRRGARGATTLLMIDIDRFKSINDHYSHVVGDRALVAVSALLKTTIREDDLVARLAGDEFVVVLSEADPKRAASVILRIHEVVAAHDWNRIAVGLRLGLSIGVARSLPGDTVEGLMERADRHMYENKVSHAGRANELDQC